MAAEGGARKILVLNGPNLNVLHLRDKATYGGNSLSDIEQLCVDVAAKLGFEAVCFQSNIEGELISRIQEVCVDDDIRAIVINAAAYSHTSIAIYDALQCFSGPVVEVHISNIHKRESFRHASWVSKRADVVICGAGVAGYQMAIEWISSHLKCNSLD